jgi:hypothetical protein
LSAISAAGARGFATQPAQPVLVASDRRSAQ